MSPNIKTRASNGQDRARYRHRGREVGAVLDVGTHVSGSITHVITRPGEPHASTPSDHASLIQVTGHYNGGEIRSGGLSGHFDQLRLKVSLAT